MTNGDLLVAEQTQISLEPVHAWFQHQNWTPLPFQTRTWQAYLEGHSGLIQVPTGSGKTFAAVMGPIARMLSEDAVPRGIRLLYLTPLRTDRGDGLADSRGDPQWRQQQQ